MTGADSGLIRRGSLRRDGKHLHGSSAMLIIERIRQPQDPLDSSA